jgi:hypothetical protein
MTKKSENIVTISIEESRARAKAWATPENLAKLDAMTDEDIAAQIASNPDAAPSARERLAGLAQARTDNGAALPRRQ